MGQNTQKSGASAAGIELPENDEVWPKGSKLREVCSEIIRAGSRFIVAFRVESALRSRDTIGALRETSRFIEVILQSMIDREMGFGNNLLFRDDGWPDLDQFREPSRTRVMQFYDFSPEEVHCLQQD